MEFFVAPLIPTSPIFSKSNPLKVQSPSNIILRKEHGTSLGRREAIAIDVPDDGTKPRYMIYHPQKINIALGRE